MIAFWLVLVPVLTGVLCLVSRNLRVVETVHVAGTLIMATIGFSAVKDVITNGKIVGLHGFFFVDALSAIVISIITLVVLTAGLHSVGYIRLEHDHGILSDRQFRWYYLWFHLFLASMLWVTVVNNMGLLWVSIEATTITSAFLIAVYKKGEALEAAWKYLIICSVGIAFALLGLIILYTSSIKRLGDSNQILNWTVLSNPHLHLEPGLVVLAFAFLLVGFGTKVGLAPLHFWLPDAHSQAPSPISAILSGGLLNGVFLALIRFGIVAHNAVGGQLISSLFIGFGLVSVAISFPFIVVQRDYKRMLAYSSVEHMGIIAVAIGFGGITGFSAALLQMFNHAMAKSMLFLTAGNVSEKYKSKQMPRVTGLLRAMPMTGTLMLVGTLAVTGVPPFSVFTSEFAVFIAGFSSGHPLVTSGLIALIAMIFGAMVYHVGQMAFGRPPAKIDSGDLGKWMTLPLLIPMLFVIVFGLFMPNALAELIHRAARIMLGGDLS